MRKISSFALAFAFVIPMAGCPGDDTGTTDSVGESGPNPTTGMTASGTDTNPTASGTDTMPGTETDPDTGTDTNTTNGGPGVCAPTCAAPEDCGDPVEDFECNDGYCEFVGEVPDCDPATCDDLMIGVCADVDGVSTCTTPCTDGGGECDLLMAECTGSDDDGNSICEFPPCLGAGEGEPCEIEGFGSFGTCNGGECTCESDEECTVPDFGCNG